MHTLPLMFQHHAWANRRVLDVVTTLDGSLVGDDAKGTFGSIAATIKHMVGVEDVYLAFILGTDPTEFGSQDTYFGHELEWFFERAAELSRAYEALLAQAEDNLLNRSLVIPWIDAPLTVREGLIQVLTHSAQHRAQILSSLGERGQQVPDLDYVVMRLEGPRSDQTAKA